MLLLVALSPSPAGARATRALAEEGGPKVGCNTEPERRWMRLSCMIRSIAFESLICPSLAVDAKPKVVAIFSKLRSL